MSWVTKKLRGAGAGKRINQTENLNQICAGALLIWQAWSPKCGYNTQVFGVLII
jgi:hypothetical protein